MVSTEELSQQYQRILQLLEEYGIDQEHIGTRACCTQDDVNCALNPVLFEQCSIIMVLRVRACIELELQARGWSGDSKDLWQAYNALIAARRHQHKRVSRVDTGPE